MDRCLSTPKQLEAGDYRIISWAIEGTDNVLTVKRGAEIALTLIPMEVLTVESGDQVLELREARGYRVPRTRPERVKGELEQIDKYTPAFLPR